MLLTRTEAAETLGVYRRDVAYLIDGGLLRTMRAGKRDLIDSDDVDRLAGFRPLDEHPAALITRVAPAERVEDPDRPFKGYATVYEPGMSPEENEQLRRDAVRGWWNVARPHEWIDAALVVSLAGFVAALYRITDVDDYEPGSRGTRFAVAAPSTEQRRAFEARRIAPIQGSNITPLAATAGP